jgi:hypothetical protein
MFETGQRPFRTHVEESKIVKYSVDTSADISVVDTTLLVVVQVSIESERGNHVMPVTNTAQIGNAKNNT